MLLIVSYRQLSLRVTAKRLKRKTRLVSGEMQASLKQDRSGTVVSLAGPYILDHRLCPKNNGMYPLMQLPVSVHARWRHFNIFLGAGNIYFHDDQSTAELKSFKLELDKDIRSEILNVVIGSQLLVVSRSEQKIWMIDVEKLVLQDQLNIQRPEWLRTESDTACLLKTSDSTFGVIDSRGDFRHYDATSHKQISQRALFESLDWSCCVSVIDCKYLDKKLVAAAYESRKDASGLTLTERVIKVFCSNTLRKLCSIKSKQQTDRTTTCLGEQIFLKRYRSRGMVVLEAAGMPQNSLNLYLQLHSQLHRIVSLPILADRKLIVFHGDAQGAHLSLRSASDKPTNYSILF